MRNSLLSFIFFPSTHIETKQGVRITVRSNFYILLENINVVFGSRFGNNGTNRGLACVVKKKTLFNATF